MSKHDFWTQTSYGKNRSNNQEAYFEIFLEIFLNTDRHPVEVPPALVLGIGKLIGPSMLRAPAEQTKVATILGIFLFFLLLLLLLIPLFKIPEGVIVGFQIFAWAHKKK